MKRFVVCLLSFMLLIGCCGCKSESEVTANPVTDFEYHLDGDYTVIDKYVGDDLSVVIPEEIESKPVISIGREAFKSSAITSVAIPDSVEIINFEAFAECDALTDVKFGNSVTYLGARSFFSCDALEKLELPRNLISLGEYAVSECKSLKELTVPKTIKRCYGFSFSLNKSLVKINFEDGLEEISYSFRQCTALETLMIPASVKRISSYIFENCNALKDVYFAGDKPDFDNAFMRSNQEEINMHYNAKEKVPTITLERTAPNTYDSETRVNPASHFHYGLDANGVMIIAEYLSSDETVVIPETIDGHPVKRISVAAFFATDIKTVIFPKTITSISAEAFHGCKSLENVYFKGDAPESVSIHPFNKQGKDFIVYYNSGTSGWDDSPFAEYYTLVPKKQ